MEKTRMGISVGLLGAALYFMGLINIVPLILLAGYVLLFESNEWLKKCAVKSVIIYVAFGLILVLLGMIDDVFGFLNVIIAWFPGAFRLDFPGGIDSLISNAVSLIRSLLLVVLGFTALSQGSVKVGKIDNMVDKNV